MFIAPHLGKQVFLLEQGKFGCVTAWVNSNGYADQVAAYLSEPCLTTDGGMIYTERKLATHIEVATDDGLLIVPVTKTYIAGSKTDPLTHFLLASQNESIGLTLPTTNK